MFFCPIQLVLLTFWGQLAAPASSLKPQASSPSSCNGYRYAWSLANYGFTTFGFDGSLLGAGAFFNTYDVDPTEGVDLRTAASQDFKYDILVQKMHSDGTYAWTYTVGSVGSDVASGAVSDEEGNIYACGGFQHTIDFDPGPGEDLHSAPEEDIYDANGFLTKLDRDGNYQWTVSFEQRGSSAVGCAELARSPDGTLVQVGAFYGSVDFDPGPGEELRLNTGGVFVSKFTLNGEHIWTRTFGAETRMFAYNGAVDAQGNIFVEGEFQLCADFDPGPGQDIHCTFSPYPSYSIFVTKFLPDGSYGWTRRFGMGNVYGTLALGLDGGPIITGCFSNSRDFDPGPGEDIRTPTPPSCDDGNARCDVYVLKLNNDGSYAWAYTVGSGYADYGTDLAVDPASGDVLVAGIIEGGTIDFDPGPGIAEYTVTDPERWNHFFLRLSSDGQFKSVLTGYGYTNSVGVDALGNVYYSRGAGNDTDVDPTCGVQLLPLGAVEYVTTKLFCSGPDGDYDLDGDVDLYDVARFQTCFVGAQDTCPPDDDCTICASGCDAFNFDAATIPAPPGSTPSIALPDYAELLPRLDGPGQ